MNKTQRLKLPKYLATVAKYVPYCVECGTTEGVQNAHYSGLYSEKLGNGMGSKSHDYCVARLCHKCHAELDQYQHGNDEDRALRFLEMICRTFYAVVEVRCNTFPAPKDLTRLEWLDEVAADLNYSLYYFIDNTGTIIGELANHRNFVEKNGR